MVGFVTIPGIGGSDDTHWQTAWERQWDRAAVRIEPASWTQPDLADWVAAIDRAVADIETRTSDVVLVAHSLGCWAASTWLSDSARRSVRGVFLVAPPDPSADAFPAVAASTFVSAARQSLPCPSVVVASSNDPYCRLDVAQSLASVWGSDLRMVGALGHINSASDLGDWSHGREMLESLLFA